MGKQDIDTGDPEDDMQCVSCYKWFRKSTEHVNLKKYDFVGNFLKEQYYCGKCSEEVMSDSTAVFDVEGDRQVCPDCGSTGIKLIPFASSDNQFTGAKFFCQSCGKQQDLEL